MDIPQPKNSDSVKGINCVLARIMVWCVWDVTAVVSRRETFLILRDVQNSLDTFHVHVVVFTHQSLFSDNSVRVTRELGGGRSDVVFVDIIAVHPTIT